MTDTKRDTQQVSISIGGVSGSGHIIVSGGDSVLSVGSDRVSQKATVQMAGVKAPKKNVNELEEKLNSLDKAVAQESLTEQQRDLAKKRMQLLRELLSKADKPDVRKLGKIMRFLLRLGPVVAAATLNVVKDKLFETILSNVGIELGQFIAAIRK